MFWFIMLGLLLLLLLGGVLLKRGLRGSQDPDAAGIATGTTVTMVILVVLFVALSFFRMVHTVDAGHVGVVYTFSDVTGQIDSGLQFTAPWQSVKVASIQVERHTFDNIASFSSETQDVKVQATLNYQTNPDAIQQLYRNVGVNWFDRLVESRVNQIFKDETVKYRSVDIAPNREQIRTAVRDRLRAELEPFSIDVVDLLIDNIDFNAEFKNAIEAKQIATQEAQRAFELVKKSQFEGQQKVEAAKGQAEANRLLHESLTPQLIQWEAVQRLSDNIQIALVPSGQGVILDPTTLLGGAKTPAP